MNRLKDKSKTLVEKVYAPPSSLATSGSKAMSLVKKYNSAKQNKIKKKKFVIPNVSQNQDTQINLLEMYFYTTGSCRLSNFECTRSQHILEQNKYVELDWNIAILTFNESELISISGESRLLVPTYKTPKTTQSTSYLLHRSKTTTPTVQNKHAGDLSKETEWESELEREE